MKEIMAIIRPNRMTKTSEVLSSLGFPAMTAWRVMGRGKQRGMAQEVAFDISPGLIQQSGMKYVPKRMISLVVDDADVALIVEVIMRVNRTGQAGDGRIFIAPIDEAVRVRTREHGEQALH